MMHSLLALKAKHLQNKIDDYSLVVIDEALHRNPAKTRAGILRNLSRQKRYRILERYQ